MRVAGPERVADTAETVPPGVLVFDPGVALGGERQGGGEAAAGAPDARSLKDAASEQRIAPAGEFGGGQKPDRLGGEARGDVLADARGIGGVMTAGNKIVLVQIDRSGDGDRRTGIGIAAARQLARLVGGLKEIEHVHAIGGFVIVGGADRLGPTTARDGDLHVPCAGALVAAVAQHDAAGERRGDVGLLAWLPARAARCDFPVVGVGPWMLSPWPVSRKCPKRGTK